MGQTRRRLGYCPGVPPGPGARARWFHSSPQKMKNLMLQLSLRGRMEDGIMKPREDSTMKPTAGERVLVGLRLTRKQVEDIRFWDLARVRPEILRDLAADWLGMEARLQEVMGALERLMGAIGAAGSALAGSAVEVAVTDDAAEKAATARQWFLDARESLVWAGRKWKA